MTRWTDHPRSRGVYQAVTRAAPVVGGSSPLARGLLHALRLAGDRPGIIPARAGFTPAPYPTISPDGDHPRSRGVYRGVGGDKTLGARIIPARAGFTVGNRATALSGWWIIPARAGFTVGNRATALSGWWIIPARAGFTLRTIKQIIAAVDHPRSRGVYRTRVVRPCSVRGSSPLARGLLARCRNHRSQFGSSPLARGLLILFGFT